jgi:hypothetical protein
MHQVTHAIVVSGFIGTVLAWGVSEILGGWAFSVIWRNFGR